MTARLVMPKIQIKTDLLLIESVDLFCLFTNHISEKDLLNRDLARLDKSKQCLENAQWVINFDDKRQNILKQNGHLGGKKLIYKYIFFRRCYLVTFNEQKKFFYLLNWCVNQKIYAKKIICILTYKIFLHYIKKKPK